ncbi:MAG: hypothetical protein KAY24_14665, partial [Candidatus Eisenbacteria sp.]|nr:hypothetical protein [Candidatus Eisenbacteria bacterium]
MKAHTHWPWRPALLALILATLVSAGSATAEVIHVDDRTGDPGLSLASQGVEGIDVHYSMDSFTIEPVTINGEPMQAVSIPGVILPTDAGTPNLPSICRYVALPQGATGTFQIVSSRSRTYQGIDVSPAPVLPDADDDSPLVYEKDASIYSQDALFPATTVQLSEPSKMRGVDVSILAITPFQYNPVTRELIVYTHLEIRIDFEGGNGYFGEDRLRSIHWEPILRNHLLNYSSLPTIDSSAPRGDRDCYEYIIVTPDHPDFIAWADTLKAWRKLQGISTETYTTTDIGGTGPYTIWAWFRDIYATWDPPPVAFTILGDEPNTGDGRDTGVHAFMWAGYCVSDNRYADAEPVPDELPDMAHGRICARDAGELETMIGKMLTYERQPPTDHAFYNHPVCAGGWQTDRWYILCTEIVYGFQANVLGKDPIREYAIHSGYPGSVWSSNSHTGTVVSYFGPEGLGYIPATPGHLTDWGGHADRLIADINAGTYFVLHRDHGNEFAWTTPYFSTSHLWYLNNDLLPFMFSINCLTGKYDHLYSCFTERYHRDEDAALGLIAASEVSSSFVNDTFLWGVFDGLWPEFDPYYPERGGGAADSIGSPDLRTAFAMASGKYYLEASSWPSNPYDKVKTYHLFHHHGEAFMQLYSEVPQDLTVAHGSICPLNASSFTITANEGALIGLTVAGEIIGVAIATGEPQQVAIIPQTEEGTLRITVTKANYYRYDVSIPIEPDQAIDEGTGGADLLGVLMLSANAPNPFAAATRIN